MAKITVKRIVVKYLKKHDFDGLCGVNCGCELDDLCPCDWDNSFADCMPAYKVKPTQEQLDEIGFSDCRWIMSESKKNKIK